MKTPLRSLSVYNTTTTQWFAQDVLAHANGKCTSMGKEKIHLEQDVSLENKDIDMHGFYIYHLFV